MMRVKLTEGPGAGYEISGKITKCHLTSAKLAEKKEVEDGFWKGIEYKYDVEGTVDIDDLTFYGYYDGDAVDSTVANIYELSVFVDIEDTEEPDIKGLEESVYPIKFSTIYGGGWMHSKFKGDLEIDFNHLQYDSIPYYEPLGLYIVLTDYRLVDYIDKAVTGDNYDEYYTVYDDNGDPVEEFDSESEAIDYAKSNGYSRVDLGRDWYDYEGIITEIETVETVWEV